MIKVSDLFGRENRVFWVAGTTLSLAVVVGIAIRPNDEAVGNNNDVQQVLGDSVRGSTLTYTDLPEIGADAPTRMPIPTVLLTPSMTVTPTIVVMPTVKSQSNNSLPTMPPTPTITRAPTPTTTPSPIPTMGTTVTATGKVYFQSQPVRSFTVIFPQSGGVISMLTVLDCTTGNVNGSVSSGGLVSGIVTGMCVIDITGYQGTGTFEGTVSFGQKLGSGIWQAQSDSTIVEGDWTLQW